MNNKNLATVITEFNNLKTWEDRYRLLIKYSREIPSYSTAELAKMHEIFGCENKLWLQGKQTTSGIWEFMAYSEARLMRGLLAIILIAINNKSSIELQQFNLNNLLLELKISQDLTLTRLKSINNINTYLNNLVTN